jgi:bZIP transcription factor
VSAADGSVAPLTAAPARTAITATAASTRPRRITRGSSKGGSNGGLAALAAKSELIEAAQQHSNPAATAFSHTALLNGGSSSSSYTAALGNGNGTAGAANGCKTDSGHVSATSDFPFSFPFPVSSAPMPAGTVPTVAGASPMMNKMLMFAGQPAATTGMAAVVDTKPVVITAAAVTAAAVGPVSTAADTADERRQKRLERNRESARQSRRRKKQYLELLQEKVAQLVGQLDTLRTVHLDDASR